jgi:hypothetical protein
MGDPNDLTKGVELVQQKEDSQGERKRLLFRIQQLGSESYIAEITRDKFDTARLADLTVPQLDQLRITLIERKRSRDRREKIDAITGHIVAQTALDFPTGHPRCHLRTKTRDPIPGRTTESKTMSTTTAPKPLLAYHGKQSIKNKFVKRVDAHAAADEIIQGKYWENGKGCLVGCAAHTGCDPHGVLEREAGIPRIVSRLGDRLFEGCENGFMKGLPPRFYRAPLPGADLSMVAGKERVK